MELQIQDLVSSIRKDGIDAANAEAEAIIAEAKKKADAIIADAKSEAKSIQEASSAITALINFPSAASQRLSFTFAERIFSNSAFTSVLNASMASRFACSALMAALADEIKNGLEIRPAKGVRAGFRLAAKDGYGYFDCSDDEIMQMLMPYFRNLDF